MSRESDRLSVMSDVLIESRGFLPSEGSQQRSKRVEVQLIFQDAAWQISVNLLCLSRSTFLTSEIDFAMSSSSSSQHVRSSTAYKAYNNTSIRVPTVFRRPGSFVADERSSSGGSAGRFLLDRLALLLQSSTASKASLCAKMPL